MANAAGFRFLPGTQVTLWTRAWIVESPIGDGRIPLRAAEGHERQLFATTKLLELLSDGQLAFVDCRTEDECKRQQAYAKAEMGLDETQQAQVDRFLRYINGLESRGIEAYSVKHWCHAIAEIAKEIGDAFKPPHPITLWRKRRQFRLGGRVAEAMISHVRLQKRSDSTEGSEAHELMRKFVDERWLDKQQLTITHVYDDYEKAINDTNETRDAANQIKAVSYQVMWRYVRQLPQALVIERRLGPKAHEKEYRQCYRAPRPKRILELVESDHSPLDAIFIDKTRDVSLGRGYLTASICVASKIITGIHVGYSPPSALSVAQMMKFAILNKSALSALVPSIKHPHPGYGLPETLVVDNAREFYSRGFIRMCAELGIKLRYARRRKPWWKPHIERLMRTLNHGFVHSLAGTTFGSVLQKGDYDSKGLAIVDFNDFTAALHKWICDFYHCRPHRGLGGRCPLQVWEEGAALYPPSLPRSKEALDAVIGLRANRVIGRMGIEFEHLFFNSEPLQLLRQRMPLGETCNIEIVLDEDDLEFLYVFDPANREPIRVPCLDAEYARGLTLHQHRVNLRNIANAGKRYVDRKELLQAKHDAYQMALGALSDSSKASAKSLAARYLNIQQTVQNAFDVTNLPQVELSAPVVPEIILPHSTIHAADLLDTMREQDLGGDEGWGVSHQ
jgi:putative transposase